MATKTIKLIKAWHMHVKGAVITPDAPVADLLIQRKIAEAVEAPQVDKRPVFDRKHGKPNRS